MVIISMSMVVLCDGTVDTEHDRRKSELAF